jgi:cell division septum initiation protein DivIVA
MNDPKGYGYRIPPTTAPASAVPEQTPRAIIEEAKARAKKIIEEAQAEAVHIKANDQSTHPAQNPGQPDDEIIVLRLNKKDDTNEA